MAASQEEAMVIYPSRWKTNVWLILGVGSCVILLLFALGIVPLVILVPAQRSIGTLLAALFFLAFAVLGIWPNRILARLLSSREPMLVFTHQEVRVGKLFGPSDIVLPWADIAAIYPGGTGIGMQLLIRPTNVPLFLSRFPPQMRFFLRINLMQGAPIAVAQPLLEMSIAAIVQEVAQVYAAELHEYQVQLAPLPSA